jgi:hypothetical protein
VRDIFLIWVPHYLTARCRTFTPPFTGKSTQNGNSEHNWYIKAAGLVATAALQDNQGKDKPDTTKESDFIFLTR